MRPPSPLLILLCITLSKSVKVVSKRGSGRCPPRFSLKSSPAASVCVHACSSLQCLSKLYGRPRTSLTGPTDVIGSLWSLSSLIFWILYWKCCSPRRRAGERGKQGHHSAVSTQVQPFVFSEWMKLYSQSISISFNLVGIEWQPNPNRELLGEQLTRGYCRVHFNSKCQQIEQQLWTNAKVKRDDEREGWKLFTSGMRERNETVI